jgi:hypothetical protein
MINKLRFTDEPLHTHDTRDECPACRLAAEKDVNFGKRVVDDDLPFKRRFYPAPDSEFGEEWCEEMMRLGREAGFSKEEMWGYLETGICPERWREIVAKEKARRALENK